ncbi:MAG: hypothetical protein ACLFSE_04020 [Spirochaetia bacterium]
MEMGGVYLGAQVTAELLKASLEMTQEMTEKLIKVNTELSVNARQMENIGKAVDIYA